ncbi:MAG: DNA alkylation repair protein [Bryobacteraceae bacterium]
MRSLRREYSHLLAQAKPELVIQIAWRLASRSGVGCRFVGYEILSHHKRAFSCLTTRHLLQLGRGINSWSAVDRFGCYLSGPAWRDGQLPNAVIRDWAQSEDRWWRRAALVSTVALSRRGEPGDVRRTTEICKRLASDTDDMVIKALSWALRELAKKHPEEARRFLDDHKQTLAARVQREVRNKITTGLKTPSRRNSLRNTTPGT